MHFSESLVLALRRKRRAVCDRILHLLTLKNSGEMTEIEEQRNKLQAEHNVLLDAEEIVLMLLLRKRRQICHQIFRLICLEISGEFKGEINTRTSAEIDQQVKKLEAKCDVLLQAEEITEPLI